MENVCFDEYYCSELSRAKETLNACLNYNIDFQNKIKESSLNKNINTDLKIEDLNTIKLKENSSNIVDTFQDESFIKIDKRLNERNSGIVEGHNWGTMYKISEVSI